MNPLEAWQVAGTARDELENEARETKATLDRPRDYSGVLIGVVGTLAVFGLLAWNKKRKAPEGASQAEQTAV